MSWRGIIDTIDLPRNRPAHPDRLSGGARIRRVRRNLRALPASPHGLGRADGGVRFRRDGASERGGAGRAHPPAGPPVRRSSGSSWRGSCWPRLRICRHGDRRRMLPSWPLPCCSSASDRDCSVRRSSGLLSRITPLSEQGAVFGTSQLGPDARQDDQLLGLQYPAGASLDRRAVLGRVRRRPHRPDAGCPPLVAMSRRSRASGRPESPNYPLEALCSAAGGQVAIEEAADHPGIGVAVPGHHRSRLRRGGRSRSGRPRPGPRTCSPSNWSTRSCRTVMPGIGVARHPDHDPSGVAHRILVRSVLGGDLRAAARSPSDRSATSRGPPDSRSVP